MISNLGRLAVVLVLFLSPEPARDLDIGPVPIMLDWKAPMCMVPDNLCPQLRERWAI